MKTVLRWDEWAACDATALAELVERGDVTAARRVAGEMKREWRGDKQAELAALEQAGVAPEDVDWLLLTHVHLDHAGGAGALMQVLPNAKLVVHPRGARHMIWVAVK